MLSVGICNTRVGWLYGAGINKTNNLYIILIGNPLRERHFEKLGRRW
jgi:hypothetical protein